MYEVFKVELFKLLTQFPLASVFQAFATTIFKAGAH
jgi:hypothetical protein